jgi:hypothetical protein
MMRRGLALAAGMVLAAATAAGADDPAPRTARDGESLARDAAVVWADDARLVYVENDEPLADLGTAERWGYLFYSPSRDAARAYSVRDGKIRTATDLGFDFEAPPLPTEWIDSAAALAAAEEKGREFREKHGGAVRAMFLVRGLLYPENPDVPTWAIVYDSSTTSGLWVVVDARSGKVVRTWRG